MARILMASLQVDGHVNPGFPLAAKLIQSGHEVLFPDAAEILQDQKRLIESHIEGDNYEAKNPKGNRRSNTESIDLEQVRESAKNGAKELIDEFVVVAKAEALETCGEKRDLVLLVKNHLESELGGAV